ncbi:hypothetical protein COV19_01530 [Candidatus Woesearchaeota archaeon CG10_big_fil_rev_8_21_14_0_10_44_13]|nr:MAG: hypothetical protein COV19_01530 [Candidatus Woesearchaeota archaeon CG10_big_fil_rev_8_21_14_0_10_44_13]
MRRGKFFAPNEGRTDRMIRALLGLVFLYMGLTISPWLYIIAAIAFLTAIDGFCLLYWLLGISTRKK